MTDFKYGSVKISNDIIDQLVAESALQVEGVLHVHGYKNGKLDKSKKDGIVTVIFDNTIEIALTVTISQEKNIYEVVEKLQESVKEQIHTMLGFDVKEVNVFVKSID